MNLSHITKKMKQDILTLFKNRLFLVLMLSTILLSLVTAAVPTVRMIDGKVTLTIGTVGATCPTDYTCDGAADDVQFQAALNALPTNGGKIQFLTGDYIFSNTVSRAIDNVIIEGVGAGAYLTNNGATALISAGAQDSWTFKDFRTDAGGVTVSSATGYTFVNLTLGTNYYAYKTDTDITADEWAIPSGRAATYVIAASDATAAEKAQADVVCDGTADDIEIEVGTLTYSYIALSSGTFHVASTMTVAENVTVEGRGMGTLLSLDYNGHMFTLSAPLNRGISMKNFRVEGNRRDYYVFYYDQGVGPGQDPDHRFEHIYIENCNGVWHNSQLGAMIIDDVVVLGGKGKAFSLYSSDNFLTHCQAGKRAYHTDTPTYGYELYVAKNWLHHCTAYKCDVGVSVRAEGNMLDNCIIELCDAEGLKMIDAYETYINNCHFRSNGGLSLTSDIVMIEVAAPIVPVANNTITNCHFEGPYTEYGIEEDTNSDNNSIIGCFFSGTHVVAPVSLVGANDVVRDNFGYVTENQGGSSLLNGNTSIAVAHGLSTTPTSVTITWRENPTNAIGDWWVSSENATHFTLNGADPGASNLDFWWEARAW